MRARLLLEPLDPLDQSGFTRALADPRERFSSLLLQPPCRHPQIKRLELQSVVARTLNNHYNLVKLARPLWKDRSVCFSCSSELNVHFTES